VTQCDPAARLCYQLAIPAVKAERKLDARFDELTPEAVWDLAMIAFGSEVTADELKVKRLQQIQAAEEAAEIARRTAGA
jgi:hypothetical protein